MPPPQLKPTTRATRWRASRRYAFATVPLREPTPGDAEQRGRERASDDEHDVQRCGLKCQLVERIDRQPDDAGEQQQKRIAHQDTPRRHGQRHAHAAEAVLPQRVFEGWQRAVGPAGEDQHC